MLISYHVREKRLKQRIAALEAANKRVKAVAIKLAEALGDIVGCVRCYRDGVCQVHDAPADGAVAAWEALGT